MSVLVVGANGLVGSSLVRTCLDRGVAVSGTYHTERPAFDVDLLELDVRDAGRVREVVDRVEPHAVVNCAAYTDVDGCEEQPELAQEVNAVGPGVLAEACADRGVSFVHLSTDYVFDGEREEPYTEADEPNPIQVYGETKLEGERRVLEGHSAAIVCRLSFVWGPHGATDELEGFPAWVLGRARDGESVPAFTDQWVTPTRAGYAAAVVLDLLDTNAEGVFHVASRDRVTPYKFGELVIQTTTEDQRLLTRGSAADVDRDARRPQDTGLSTALLERTLGIESPALETEIEAVLDE